MRVVLLNPPRHHEISCPTPDVLEKNRGHNPPLGVLFIAAILEELGHDVQVIDTQVEEYSHEQVDRILADAEYDLLGLTVMTFSLIDSIEVSRSAKRHHPDRPIVWGGPHTHIFGLESAQLPEVDYVVTGEGELSIEHLVAYLENRESWDEVKGVGRWEDGRYLYNGAPELIADLDRLPFVARHLTPYRKYGSILAKGSVVTTMFTSRGCPYKCSFCDRPQLRPNFRSRSSTNVVDEMEHCVSMGINEFILYDDTFSVDKKRVHRICDEILERGLKIFWDCRTNINSMDKDLLKHMAAAGCVGIHYGVEAGTPKIQKAIRKNLSLDRVAGIFRLTNEAGIKSMAYFIIGNPTETRDDIEEGFRFLKSIDADFVHITALLPFPATQIYLDGQASGVIKYDYWREFAKDPDPAFVTPHWPEIFSKEELDDLIVKGYRAYYLRPRYVLHRLRQIRSLGELLRNVKFGLGVLMMTMGKGRLDERRFFDFRDGGSRSSLHGPSHRG
jgi:radical SAM superfamily enzyme YgiQ (UPF0313 family)